MLMTRIGVVVQAEKYAECKWDMYGDKYIDKRILAFFRITLFLIGG